MDLRTLSLIGIALEDVRRPELENVGELLFTVVLFADNPFLLLVTNIQTRGVNLRYD